MAQATATRLENQTGTGNQGQADVAESMLRTIDKSTQQSTGISLFHILTLGSIGASIALFLAGKKEAGIFVGLWPPTFQALKAVTEKKNREE
jgi:patatin-like phospholipase/acyl hydrolase